jgi:hypothetical protein
MTSNQQSILIFVIGTYVEIVTYQTINFIRSFM